MPLPKALLASILLAAIAMTAGAQDLLQRARGDDRPRVTAGGSSYQGLDRLDLRVGGSFPSAASGDRGYARIGLSAGLDSDFACGKFDVRANLKSLVGKEAREDMLDTLIGAIESELLYNGLVLICEASPTACQAYQHFRVNANAMLGIGYDRCQAIESGVQDGIQSGQARSLKDCIARKQQEGKTLDQALAACDKASTVSGLTGSPVAEFSLGRELEKALNLPPGETRELQRFLSDLRVKPNSVSGEIKGEAVLEEYARVEREYQEAWRKAVESVQRHPEAPLDPETAAKLQPENSPGPLPVDVRDVAELPVDQRSIYIRWLAGLAALQTLEGKVQKVERYLVAATQIPQMDAGNVQRIEREITSLRTQLRHVDEYVRRQEAHNQALLTVIRAAEAQKRERAASSLARAKSSEQGARQESEYGLKFGALRRPPPPPPPGQKGGTLIQGKGCVNCPDPAGGKAKP